MAARERAAQMRTVRITNMADGVFAIVLTLIVFDLRIPTEIEDLFGSIFNIRNSILTYIISFLLLGYYWVAHHNQVDYVKRVDQVFMWLNVIYMMLVSLVPFTANILGRYSGQSIAQILYCANLAALSLLHYAMWRYATNFTPAGNRRLVENDLALDVIRRGYTQSLVPLIFFVLALFTSFIAPASSIFLYLLVPIWVLWDLVRSLRQESKE
jgi:uncharacterized membrane protein